MVWASGAWRSLPGGENFIEPLQTAAAGILEKPEIADGANFRIRIFLGGGEPWLSTVSRILHGAIGGNRAPVRPT